MVASSCSEEEFIKLFTTLGPHKTARVLEIPVRRIFERRANWEKRNGKALKGPVDPRTTRFEEEYPPRAGFNIKDGTILVASDAHYWPGPVPRAHLALLKMCKELRPQAVIMNGDVMECAVNSRHPPIGWERRPTLIEEVEVAQCRMQEIELAAEGAQLFWPLGNHDARFETRLATAVPEYAKVAGMHLRDHFGNRWQPCWSVWINDSVVVKHRFKGGIHATHTNVLWSGKTIITGHLHSLKVTPFDDYNGIRFGVDTGCLADPNGKQFLNYTEDNPKNWRSGFVVLTFRDGRLMWPELVYVDSNGRVEFRGDFIEVDRNAKARPQEKVRAPKAQKRLRRR